MSAAGAPPVPYRAKRTARDQNHGHVHLTIKAAHLLDELALALAQPGRNSRACAARVAARAAQMKHAYRQGLRAHVVALADKGESVRSISQALSADQSYVRTTLRRNGFVRVVRWVRRDPELEPPLLKEVRHGSG